MPLCEVNWPAFDLVYRRFHESTKFLALLFRDRCPQILDFRCCFRTKTTNATSEIPLIQE